MDQTFAQPDDSALQGDAARRVAMTLSCRDSDGIPKVKDAGEVQSLQGRAVQVMHNGLLIDEGCYYGPWMTHVIRGLRGHHEPQEELIFDAIVSRLARSDVRNPTIIEFGSFWSYYSMWFSHALDGARAVAMEPDPQYLEVGKRNAELNGLTSRIQFVHGAVGGQPGEVLEFRTESTGELVPVIQHDLCSLMELGGLADVDLVMVDIQGFETVLLERARDLLTAGRVRFIVVSTHHQAISGDPLTHQRALDLLRECGAHIVGEHTVRESYSGDGLIAASFDPDHRDLVVPISHARAKESLFGEAEYELHTLGNEFAYRDQLLDQSAHTISSLRTELEATSAERDAATRAVAEMSETKLWRWSSLPRAQYARLRKWRQR